MREASPIPTFLHAPADVDRGGRPYTRWDEVENGETYPDVYAALYLTLKMGGRIEDAAHLATHLGTSTIRTDTLKERIGAVSRSMPDSTNRIDAYVRHLEERPANHEAIERVRPLVYTRLIQEVPGRFCMSEPHCLAMIATMFSAEYDRSSVFITRVMNTYLERVYEHYRLLLPEPERPDPTRRKRLGPGVFDNHMKDHPSKVALAEHLKTLHHLEPFLAAARRDVESLSPSVIRESRELRDHRAWWKRNAEALALATSMRIDGSPLRAISDALRIRFGKGADWQTLTTYFAEPASLTMPTTTDVQDSVRRTRESLRAHETRDGSEALPTDTDPEVRLLCDLLSGTVRDIPFVDVSSRGDMLVRASETGEIETGLGCTISLGGSGGKAPPPTTRAALARAASMAKKIREEVRAIDEGKPSLLAATMRKLGIRRVVVRTWAGRFGGVKDVAWDPLADIRLHT